MEQPIVYRGVDLLDKVFEFTAMTPDRNQWNRASLQSNPPRLIRFKQIESLLSAFFDKEMTFLEKAKTLFTCDSRVTIQSLINGDFLDEYPISEYEGIITFMKKISMNSKSYNDRPIHDKDLIIPYQQIIKYKRQVRDLLTFNSGVIEASSFTSQFYIRLTNSISQNILGKYDDLDHALELFINPKDLSFTEEVLKTKYGFPSENLEDLDMEWM